MKALLAATVKATTENGGFVAVASMPSLDRDGEVIQAGAFNPLRDSVPIHIDHDMTTRGIVGRARPYYEGDRLMLEGTFAKTPSAQEIRGLVVDGMIGHMSVGFMAAKRSTRDGVPTITAAELLEVSFVTVPSLREAMVLQSRSFRPQSGREQAARVRALLAVAEAELALTHASGFQAREAARQVDPEAVVARAKRLLADHRRFTR